MLFLALGLVALVGVNIMSDLLGEASASNDTNIQQAASGGKGVITPLFTVLGYGVLLIGPMVAKARNKQLISKTKVASFKETFGQSKKPRPSPFKSK